MIIDRKFKKLGWWDFLEYMEKQLLNNPSKTEYIEFLDELRLRLLESVSEGGTFKLKAPTEMLKQKFIQRMEVDDDFANSNDLSEVNELASSILD